MALPSSTVRRGGEALPMTKTTGILIYSPELLGEHISPNWWLILICDNEIGRYYRHLYHLSTHRVDQLQRPAWSSHVSVIRNEEPPNKELWEKYAQKQVEVQYSTEIKTNGEYFWLKVFCPWFMEVREELGLSSQPLIPFHLSIGHHFTSQ